MSLTKRFVTATLVAGYGAAVLLAQAGGGGVTPTGRGGVSVTAAAGSAFANLVYSTSAAIANLAFGSSTAYVMTGTASAGHDNLFIGLNAGDEVTDGIGNLGIGHSALGSLTTGLNNLAVGWDSQYVNTTGGGNVSVGEDALKSVTTGNNNTGFGYTAGYTVSTGISNTAVGEAALYNNATGNNNTAVGLSALINTTGGNNTGVGLDVARNNAAGSGNTLLGFQAGRNTAATAYSGNVFLGNQAGYYETGSNTLMIDNVLRASEADARVKALIYGGFDAATANQYVRVNGALQTVGGNLLYAISTPTESNTFGTTEAIAGKASAFRITVGTSPDTQAVVAFGSTFASAPVCTASNETTANLVQAVATTTGVTLNGVVVAGDKVVVSCLGY